MLLSESKISVSSPERHRVIGDANIILINNLGLDWAGVVVYDIGSGKYIYGAINQ